MVKGQVIVFGGAGFIGANLMASLMDQGNWDVISADIADPILPVEGVRYIKCDIRKPISLPSTAGRVERVYNLAAVHRTPGHEDHEYFDTNVPGAVNICAFCNDLSAKNIVFTSSIAVYGPSEQAKDEGSLIEPVSAYGKSKLEAENIHREWAANDETRKLVILRPAVIFGPGEGGNFSRLATALKRRVFFYPGRRDTIKGCGYVGELLASMEYALNLKRNVFLYNFCYPETYTIQDICEAYHKVGGLPLPWGTIPLIFMLAAAAVFEILALIGITTGINRARVMKLVRSTHIVPKALVQEGYQFQTTLETGLQQWSSISSDGSFV